MYTEADIRSAIREASAEIGVALKEKQQEALLYFCRGRDVFVSLPTGYGKSMIYGILPVVFNKLKRVKNSVVICISPLSAIMMEQSEKFSKLGIVSQFVGEAQKDPTVRQQVLNGFINLVYISPENIICNTYYRGMLLTPHYKRQLVSVVIDEAHCIKTWGDEFRKAFAAIGELRSIIPSHVNIMALTATATCETFDAVMKRLSLSEPMIVAISPNRSNIKLFVRPSEPLREFALQLADDLKKSRQNYAKTIVFCNSYNDCSNLYAMIVQCLGKEKTVPPGYPNLLEYRMLTMFTRASTDNMKEEIMSLFAQKETTLRVIIATAAFGMGVDIPDVHQIIHWGPPSTIEQYMQEIGRAGRDEGDSIAILIDKKNRFTTSSMKSYVKNEKECRRLNLYKHFIKYVHSDSCVKFKCCDICAMQTK